MGLGTQCIEDVNLKKKLEMKFFLEVEEEQLIKKNLFILVIMSINMISIKN